MIDKVTVQKTRDLIAERGLAKEVLLDGEGRLCLYGAFNLANFGAYNPLTTGSSCFRDQQEFARLLGFDHIGQAIAWNNAEERTQGEVLERLDDVIAQMDENPNE